MSRFPLLAAAVLLAGFFAGYGAISGSSAVSCAYAQGTVSCGFCSEAYCYNPEAGRKWKEYKKARARAEGLPERLLALFDRLDDCEACIRNAPDWVHIQYVYDKKAYEKKYGRAAPYDSRSMPWSRDLEMKIREEMKDGVIREFHLVHYGNKPCRCCRARNKQEWKKWYDGHDVTYKDYNEDLEFDPGAAISFTDKRKLGDPPADLTEIPPSYKRGDSVQAPPLDTYLDPPARIVHVVCRECEKFEAEYNKYSRYINDQRRPLAHARRAIFFDRQAIDAVWGELAGIGQLAHTDATEKQHDKLMKELGQRLEQLDRDKRKLQEMLDARREWEEKQAEVMRELLECERTGCKPRTETGAAAPDGGDGVEDGKKDDKNVVPGAKSEAASGKSGKSGKPLKGGACKKPVEAPAIAIGPNSKYGTGAQTRKKVTETVGGALMGGLMKGMGGGGGGGGMGMVPGPMGGGKGAAKGPKTVKDPVGKKLKLKMPKTANGTGMSLGGAFTDKGLVISSTIDEAKGSGTFHAVYLEDCNKQRLMPMEYFIYELWRDWKLTVWWTHDRWVNGQHVLHEAGETQETGRQTTGPFFFYKKGNEAKGIWNMMGFDNATNGIKSLGTAFNVTKDDLAKGPLNLVVHTTLPAGETVMTDPQVYEVSLDAKGNIQFKEIK